MLAKIVTTPQLIAIIAGWIVVVGMIVMFNYGAHLNDPDDDED